jgi:magnesium chelatase subunit D
MIAEAPQPWARALRAMAALAVDPGTLKGLTLRARAGPVRQTAEIALSKFPGPQRRIHPGLTDTDLFGGLNISASLAEGRLVQDKGVADRPATLFLPMAERCPQGLATRLGQLLDAGRGHALILLDEGADPEEEAPAALRDRLAFHVDLTGVHWSEVPMRLPAPADIEAARARLTRIALPEDAIQALTVLAVRFGIDSLRAPLLALATARALAALDHADEVIEAHLTEAAELVYPARATQLTQDPEQDDPPQEAEAPPDDDDPSDGEQDTSDTIPDEVMIAAVAALLPDDLLDRVTARSRSAKALSGGGAGARRRGNRKGHPLAARPGHPDGRARIDVIATLRAAVPWQAMRPKRGHARIVIHPSDIRLRRYEDRSDRLVIFIVDASGSAAMARLAEAKGAVELLLGQAYARRDHVALVGFRGTGAETLLPPTRSLVQAKRRLAALPGGGGTPLAAGLEAAAQLAEQARSRGLSPAFALLTDGRANIALDGAPGRVQAQSDAATRAARLGTLTLQGCVIDTAPRPGAEAPNLARALGVECMALPRADAQRLSQAIETALDG